MAVVFPGDPEVPGAGPAETFGKPAPTLVPCAPRPAAALQDTPLADVIANSFIGMPDEAFAT